MAEKWDRYNWLELKSSFAFCFASTINNDVIELISKRLHTKICFNRTFSSNNTKIRHSIMLTINIVINAPFLI